MTHANPISSSMVVATHLSKFDSYSLDNLTIFRSIVGSLQYISLTKPDISFSVNKVCQFVHDPKLSHWTAVKCIIRYLKSTINHGMFFFKKYSLKLHVYSNADWAECSDDRRSTGSFYIFFEFHPISWNSKKHQTIVRSNTKVKYKSLANTSAKLIWLQTIIKELGFPLTTPLVLWCDNFGATYLTSNLV